MYIVAAAVLLGTLFIDVLDEIGEDEKALPSDASIRDRMAIAAHDVDLFCLLDFMLNTASLYQFQNHCTMSSTSNVWDDTSVQLLRDCGSRRCNLQIVSREDVVYRTLSFFPRCEDQPERACK